MLAEIITIGDELLIGQVVDTNSAFIAKELNKIGVSVYQITSVQDDKNHILQAFKDAESRVEIIIITGGLGPTKDDITKKTIAEYFNDTLVLNDSVLKNIKTIWKQYVRQTLLQVNKDQALVPSKAKVLMNKIGTAPGMWIENNNKIFISLPGVPFEMKALMLNEVLPKLTKRYHLPFILHKTLLVYGLGESTLAAKIEAWEDALPKTVKLAYLPDLGRVRLRLSAKGFEKEKINEEVQEQIENLLPLIKDNFFGFEDEEGAVESIIAKHLTHIGKNLAVAESCTGGQIAERLTMHAGASNYFKGSVVSYATDSKINVLGISKELIDTYSVVSSQVAEAMAKQVLQLFNSDFAMATTGNAGPTKGDSDEEVGTVFIAIATKKEVYSEKFMLGNLRSRVINKAVNKAFEMLLKEIFKN
ncbi:MAG: competence/damage-inducible protein A [Flavobacteriales bacterium]|nr:competence/damage-inducible protein A [Flavobacteriales bacterium]PIV92590.1 MAG: competence/damage-inducible protein A [Flavobacteriaceae bacterium CG17_big_fil_post_rev_8_21_14_2_50_33_15]PIY12985.1 MAG: competence/damage-inducible protein A [Flavobacteriaceae bacterium CG_4_10_14_3_um_filter_33_47]PJB20095.1 MAG: competence/damage-inducible protein A [Flavobacteriaceae bacterium CG_4_9_14_3_um_filter_33_16]NCP52809.1 competence/damage-inducible protein A [Flavobacteriales bacterium]